MGLPLAAKCALTLSTTAYLFSAVALVFLLEQLKRQSTVGKFTIDEIILCIGGFSVFLCGELSQHLHQVLHTKWFVFAPPKGSAAAETNPSEPLLAALHPRSLELLAYDLGEGFEGGFVDKAFPTSQSTAITGLLTTTSKAL